ncbi:MAG: hypothetical protein H6618_03465 [Deltaproteobacteria bacterium]|nr:hypothetical protein [Deltaproteobacteria bacterium]
MNGLLEILLSKKVSIPDKYDQYKEIFRHFRGKEISLENLKIKDKSQDNIFNDPEKFYLESPTEGFLMGDILKDISPIWIGSNSDKTGSVIRKSGDSRFMILSTECDCELRENGSHLSYIRVCPVYDEEEIVSLMKGDTKEFRGYLQANSVIEYFWMPRTTKKGNGLVADLSHIFSVETESLHEFVSRSKINRVCSLSQTAFFTLQIKLAWFFSRPEPEDTQRSNLNVFQLL